jgi:hypothetical protein
MVVSLYDWLMLLHVPAAMGMARRTLIVLATQVLRSGESDVAARFVASLRVIGPLLFGSAMAVVLGVGIWMVLVTLLAAEVNVVRKRRLWPRAIVQPPLTEADERTLRSYAEQEERRPEEVVAVRDRPDTRAPKNENPPPPHDRAT